MRFGVASRKKGIVEKRPGYIFGSKYVKRVLDKLEELEEIDPQTRRDFQFPFLGFSF